MRILNNVEASKAVFAGASDDVANQAIRKNFQLILMKTRREFSHLRPDKK
jgi:hypothetical protein